MIQHCVFLNLRANADQVELGKAIADIRALVGEVPGFEQFCYGPNRDYEAKSAAYDVGFICEFTNREALTAYATNPTHQAAGAVLVAQCEGGADGIMVVDLEV